MKLFNNFKFNARKRIKCMFIFLNFGVNLTFSLFFLEEEFIFDKSILYYFMYLFVYNKKNIWLKDII